LLEALWLCRPVMSCGFTLHAHAHFTSAGKPAQHKRRAPAQSEGGIKPHPTFTRSSSSSLSLDTVKIVNRLVARVADHNIELRRQLCIALNDLHALREELSASRGELCASKAVLQDARQKAINQFAGCGMALPTISLAGHLCGGICAERQESTLVIERRRRSETIMRLRYFSACPLEMPHLDIDEDLQDIEGALQGTMEVVPEVASVASLAQVAAEAHDWIHITAHTRSSGKSLALEDEACSLGSKMQLLSHADLERLFSSGGGARINFVFLSACESGPLARAFRASGVQHVIFCPTAVHDSRARCFARSVYSGLARHLSLEHAFSIARCAAELSGDDAQYGMLSDGTLKLAQAPPRQPVFELPRAPVNHMQQKRRIEDFVGRFFAIRSALRYLGMHRRRVVLIHGAPRMGVSATLMEIAHRVKMPGRKLPRRDSCAFYPHGTPGGFLIVDDIDLLCEQGAEEVRRHLGIEGAQVLAGCHNVDRISSVGDDKPMCVRLHPLQAAEAAELFLLRCQRPLLVEDLLRPLLIGGRNPKEVISRSEALYLLSLSVQAFGGIPGTIRCAVDRWAKKGSPCLQGDPSSLALTAGEDMNRSTRKRSENGVRS